MTTEKTQEHWIKGASSALWPIFAFVVLFSFWSPLHTIANRVPDLIDKSKVISIAGLKIELDTALRFRKPSPPVEKALKNLYAEDLKLLIKNPDSALFAPIDQVTIYREQYAHLMELDLVREMDTTMLSQGAEKAHTGKAFKLSPVGVEAKAYVIDLIVSTFVGAGARAADSASQPTNTP
jgi:hypothetical protein